MNINFKMMSLNFCFIGAGNLATQVSHTFVNKGYKIVQVYSHTEKSAKILADKVHCSYTTSTSEINKTADVYFVALKDSVLEEVLSLIDFQNKLVVHCSGSLPLSVLEKYSKNTGVFYPLQTFSKKRTIDFYSVPIFIESNSTHNEAILFRLAEKISNSVFILNSDKRKKVHIAAVFACNFVNHFYTIASEILKEGNISFEVLKPLILETAQKVQKMNPEKVQTGPAVRFDKNIISDHLNVLKEKSEIRELYKTLSESIFEYHKKLK